MTGAQVDVSQPGLASRAVTIRPWRRLARFVQHLASGSMSSTLVDNLGEVVRKVALAEIAPRFRKLAPSDVVGKPSAEDPTDLVTVADRAAEAELTRELTALMPDASVVGEEADRRGSENTRADRRRRARVDRRPARWNPKFRRRSGAVRDHGGPGRAPHSARGVHLLHGGRPALSGRERTGRVPQREADLPARAASGRPLRNAPHRVHAEGAGRSARRPRGRPRRHPRRRPARLTNTRRSRWA